MNHLLGSLKLFILSMFVLCVFSTATFAQSCHFGGSWNTNFGQMTLSQTGRKVSGTLAGEKITGEVNGYIFQGSYWVGSYPADLTFYITPNCNGIQGEYASGANTYKMNATRLTHQPHAPSSPSSSQYVQKSGGYGLPTYTKTSTQSAYKWDGTWSTTSGTLRLWKTGPQTIEGSYKQNHSRKGYIQGSIKGTIRGNKASCTWSEGPSYRAPNDAGQVVFTMAPGSNSFTGNWRFGYNEHYNNWKTGWDGARTSY